MKAHFSLFGIDVAIPSQFHDHGWQYEIRTAVAILESSSSSSLQVFYRSPSIVCCMLGKETTQLNRFGFTTLGGGGGGVMLRAAP